MKGLNTIFALGVALSLSGSLSVVADAHQNDYTSSTSRYADADSDGIMDSVDNCQLRPNADQRDTDSDGFGNVCDGDFNGDCIVNVLDSGILRSEFFTSGPDTDINGDGIVNVIDLGLFKDLFFETPGPSGQPNNCSSPMPFAAVGGLCDEGGLAGREGTLLLCEDFESQTWYDDNGYVDGQSITPSPVNVANQLDRVSIVNSPECLSGSCLEGDWDMNVERTLAVVWPLKAAHAADSSFDEEPEEMYMRYYLKVGPNWNADQLSGAEGNGKLFGFADGRENDQSTGEMQCGNGGATPDGSDCWTARGLFWHCEDLGGTGGWAPDATCGDVADRQARIGSYIYANGNANQVTGPTGVNAIFDGFGENQGRGTSANETNCRRSGPPGTPEHIDSCYNQNPDNYFAGLGKEMNVLRSNVWMSIETFVKMNDPGVANGELRGWIDGVLAYEKTDIIWRQPGHDNLHVRTVWLDLYKGGTSGNTTASKSWVDNMVVSTEYIGPRVAPGVGQDAIDAMAPGTWYEIPNSRMNDTIDSCDVRTCNYSGTGGFEEIVAAWSGGALDTTRNELLIFGGGHDDYGGNEVAGFDLETKTWRLITTPSSADQDSGPSYADGRPVSRHTYGTLQYSPERDSLMVFGTGSSFPDSFQDTWAWQLNLDGTPTWTRGSDIPVSGNRVASTAHDTATGDFWYMAGNQAPTSRYDTSADSWENSGSLVSVIHMNAAMDPVRKKILRLGRSQAYMYDVSGTPTRINLNNEPGYTSSDINNLDSRDGPGLDYHPGIDKFVWWDQSAGASVYLIDPDTYIVEERLPSPGNTVTPAPGPSPANGTYGRFRYSESRGVFVLVTSVEENVWVYKIDES